MVAICFNSILPLEEFLAQRGPTIYPVGKIRMQRSNIKNQNCGIAAGRDDFLNFTFYVLLFDFVIGGVGNGADGLFAVGNREYEDGVVA